MQFLPLLTSAYCSRVEVKDHCKVKPPTGEESKFQLEHEAAPGQRDLGILSSDKVAVMLQVLIFIGTK